MKISPKFVLLVTTTIVVAAALVAGTRSRVPYERNQPLVFSISPTSAGPDQDLEMTVTMDGSTTEDVYVSIGCTVPSAFTNLPEGLVIPYGQTQAMFTAHTSSTYSSWAVVAATANGGTALAVTPVSE